MQFLHMVLIIESCLKRWYLFALYVPPSRVRVITEMVLIRYLLNDPMVPIMDYMLLACDELEAYFAIQNLASQTAEGREVLCEVGSGLEPTSLPPLAQ